MKEHNIGTVNMKVLRVSKDGVDLVYYRGEPKTLTLI